MKRLFLALILVLAAGTGPARVAWCGAPSAPDTILMTPFRFYAAQDVAFLNYGILEMLTTRLLGAGTIRVEEWTKSPVDQAAAVELALKQEADFILVGGITLFDDRVSTDARLLDADTGRAVLLFSRFGHRPGDVLVHIDLLASEIIALFEKQAEAGE